MCSDTQMLIIRDDKISEMKFIEKKIPDIRLSMVWFAVALDRRQLQEVVRTAKQTVQDSHITCHANQPKSTPSPLRRCVTCHGNSKS